MSEHSTDEHRLLLGKPVPFVGREAELMQLFALASAAAAEGAPRAAIVVAPPGHGKTRLRQELMSRLTTLEFPVRMVVARFEPGSEHLAFSGVARGLRSAIGLAGCGTSTEQRQRLGEFGRRLGLSDVQLSFLASLTGVASDLDEPVLSLARASGEIMREGFRDALRAFLQGMANGGLAVFMLEDAHWADASSLALMGELVALHDLPAVAIAFTRPELLENQPDLWRKRSPLRIDLSPLTPRLTRRLVQAVLDHEPADDVVERIVSLGAGSPLVVEELLRAFVSSGNITPSTTAKAVFEGRIARLAPLDRLVARTAAVVGEVFWDAPLVRVLGATGCDVQTGLRNLVREELISLRPQARFAGTKEYAFRHALLRDAAEATMPADARRGVHGSVARWLVDSGVGEHGLIALHAERADLRSLAGEQWALAAYEAAGAGASAAAIDMLERSLTLAPRTGPERTRVLFALEELYRDTANVPKRMRHLAALRTAARKSHDDGLRATVALRESLLRYDAADYAGARRLAENACALAMRGGTAMLLAEARLALSDDLRELGALKPAEELLGAASESLSELPPLLQGKMLRARGILQRRLGRAQLALQTYGDAIALHERSGLRSAPLAQLWNARAYAFIVDGQLEAAERCVQSAIAMVRSCGAARNLGKMIGNEAVLSMIGGDLERAARASEGALAAHLESSDFDALADTGLIRAQIALAQVDMDTAWKRLLEAEKLVHASGARYDMVHAGLTRAWLLRHEGDLAGALSALREVRVQGWSSRAMEAAVMSESARVQRKLGRLADAEADARAALDALAEIDGSEWGIQTFEAVLEALDSVPRDVRTSAAQRAALYVESMRGKVGETWRAAFDRRADVQKLKELASS